MKKYLLLFALLFFVSKVYSQEFITRWDLTSPLADTIKFTISSTGPVYYTWETIPAGSSGSGFITGTTAIITGMPTGSTIRLKIDTANFRHFQMNGPPSIQHPKDIEQWGAVHWTSMEGSFNGCTFLNISATDIPDLSSVTSMANMFQACGNLNGPNNIGSWNTQNVQNMSKMFFYAYDFNQDISSWNTQSVQNMSQMFSNASSFNQNIGNWNTGSVHSMSAMFRDASLFNQNIGNWNTGLVQDMSEMFFYATSFNQNIGNWNTGSVQSMNAMFRDATSFNQNIGNWNTSAVLDMSQMFDRAISFNQNIGNWNTGSVQDLSEMFRNTDLFNQNIGNWNTSAVINMSQMFSDAKSFNQNIGNWNTSSVQNMFAMFYNASSFNQDLGTWQLNTNVNINNMFDNCRMNCSGYSSTLSGWSNNGTTTPGRILGAANMFYENSAMADRDLLINAKGWSIVGDAPCWPTSTSLMNALNLICSISPNPAKEQAILKIQSENIREVLITVYNSFGSIVFEDKVYMNQSDNSYILNTEKWSNGVYIVRTQMANNTFINRMVVSK